MTSEPLYESIITDACARYLAEVEQAIEDMTPPTYEYNGNLKSLISYKELLEQSVQAIRNYSVPEVGLNVHDAIVSAFQPDMDIYKEKLMEYEIIKEKFVEASKQEYEEEVEGIKAKAKESIAPLTKKHQELLEYKNKLQSVMEHYGVTPNDTKVSEDITKEEFETLLDISLMTCKNIEGRAHKLLKKVTKPFEDGDDRFAIAYLILLFLCASIFLPVIAVAYIFAMLKNTRTIYHDIDRLRIAESLMYTVSFDKYIPATDEYAIPDYDEESVNQVLEEQLVEVEELNPQMYIDEALKEFNTNKGIAYMESAVNKAEYEGKQLYGDLMSAVDEKLASITELVEKEMAELKMLGDEMSLSAVMSTSYVVGYSKGVVPVVRDYGLTNINFKGTYQTSGLLETLKLFFVNALMNVRANCMEVTVFDTEYLGQAFSEFITPKTAPYIKVYKEPFSKFQEVMQQKASENLMACKKETILEYNKRSEELGMVTRTYQLFIILTGIDKKLEENKPLMKLIEYSAKSGVFIWMIRDEELPGLLNLDIPLDVPENEKILYDIDLGSRALATFEWCLENNKQKALDYRKGYLLKYLPKDKWWKSNSIKGINIRFGLEDGDPSKALCLHFDDKNVHCLLGGATGAGKSVAIDCTLQNMLHEYAPDEFQIVYIDMKNAEVAKYTKDGFSKIPHALIVAGTTDGEYCLSIFDWALDEMTRRLGVCREYGVQKVEDLRKKFDDPSRPDYDIKVHIPRTLILIDEFQVMFDTSRIPAKIVDKIGGRITSLVKLARAASMHLWFTSQEMSGTLSKNVLDNFSTRGALRCTKEISTTLIGNDASGKIKEKVGWMYSNDSAGQDPNANKLWRVPYGPIDDLMQGIDELREKVEKEGRLCLKAKFFDEKEGRTVDDFNEAYQKFEAFSESHFMVLGERTVYSTRPTPLNFRFVKDDKENLFCAAFERQDAMDLIGTLIDNIMKKGDGASLLINSSDKDTTYLLNLEQYMPEGWEDFLDTNYELDTILEDLEELADSKSEQDESTLKPVYIMFLMWEKKEGVGQSESFKKTERLATLIKELNAYDVHFIFVSREQGVPKSLMNLCNHRICAKAEERTALALIDETAPFKFPGPNGDEACFAIYKYGSDLFKFKIYRHKLERELEARQL